MSFQSQTCFHGTVAMGISLDHCHDLCPRQLFRYTQIVNECIDIDFNPCAQGICCHNKITPIRAFGSQNAACLHGLLQIVDDIFGILKSNTETEEAILINLWVMGQLVAVLIVVNDQALHIAQGHRMSH